MNVARICGGMSITAGPESPERAGCPRPPCLPPRIMILNGESDVASAAARNSEQAALGGLMPFGCHASQLIWMNTVKSVDLGTYAYIPGTNRACVDGKTVIIVGNSDTKPEGVSLSTMLLGDMTYHMYVHIHMYREVRVGLGVGPCMRCSYRIHPIPPL